MRRAYETFSATNDVEQVLPLFHPEFETSIPAELSVEPDTYSGHDGVRRYMGSFYDVMDEITFELVDTEEVGEWVIAHTLVHTRAHHTGIESAQELWLAWRFEDGLAIEGRPYPSHEEALAGLAER